MSKNTKMAPRSAKSATIGSGSGPGGTTERMRVSPDPALAKLVDGKGDWQLTRLARVGVLTLCDTYDECLDRYGEDMDASDEDVQKLANAAFLALFALGRLLGWSKGMIASITPKE